MDFQMNEVDITKFENFNSFKERFLSFFPENSFKEGQENNCWEWQGKKRNPKKRFTYGTISWGQGSHYLAHRMAYSIFNGVIKNGLQVLHKCHNTLCVNPAHLVLGNHSDNMTDMLMAERSPNIKLNEEAVKVIKWMLKYEYKKGLCKKLAFFYGVSRSTITSIKKNHHWAWVKV
jgi:hypothetical protein